MVCSTLFSIFFSFNLRNYIFQSAKKCEMTSFSMTSPHVNLNEAAKCLDPCVPLAIKTIMTVLFKILELFHFKTIRSSSLNLNEIMIALIAKGTQGTLYRSHC